MYLGMFSHFQIFPGTQLILCMFLSFPGFSRCSRCFLLRTSCLTVVPFRSCHFRIFPLRPNHLTIVPVDGCAVPQLPVFSTSRFLRFGPAISKLIPCSYHFRSFTLWPSHLTPILFPVFVISGLSDVFRFGRLTIDKFLSSFRVLAISRFSRLSRLFPNTRLTIAPFHVPVISGFCRSYPDWSRRHKIVPLPAPLISGFFRGFIGLFPT